MSLNRGSDVAGEYSGGRSAANWGGVGGEPSTLDPVPRTPLQQVFPGF